METVQPIRDKDKIEELKTFLRIQSYRDWFMFTIGINSGMRISDLLQLKVSDVRGRTHIIIKEHKTGKVKRFHINSYLRRVVNDYTQELDDSCWLFSSRKGGMPISRIQAYRILHKAATATGLQEIGTHTMRKTFGYHFYKKTKDVALLQEIFNSFFTIHYPALHRHQSRHHRQGP